MKLVFSSNPLQKQKFNQSKLSSQLENQSKAEERDISEFTQMQFNTFNTDQQQVPYCSRVNSLSVNIYRNTS